MDDDKRDELLIRLDERTNTMMADVKELKNWMLTSSQRLDRLEGAKKNGNGNGTPPASLQAQPEDKAGKMASIITLVAEAPLAFHITVSLVSAAIMTMGGAIAWAASHWPKLP